MRCSKMTKDVKKDIPTLYKKYIYNVSVGLYISCYPIDYITKEIYSVIRKYFDYIRLSDIRDYVYKSIYDYLMKQKQQGN